MNRQGIEVDPQVLSEMESIIINLIESKVGLLFVSSTENEEDPGSMAFFGLSANKAYYIFGANDPKFRNAHTGTAVLWESFYDLCERGIREVDLEGVNSPKEDGSS